MKIGFENEMRRVVEKAVREGLVTPAPQIRRQASGRRPSPQAIDEAARLAVQKVLGK